MAGLIGLSELDPPWLCGELLEWSSVIGGEDRFFVPYRVSFDGFLVLPAWVMQVNAAVREDRSILGRCLAWCAAGGESAPERASILAGLFRLVSAGCLEVLGMDLLRWASRSFSVVALAVASDLHALDAEGFSREEQDRLLDAANLAVFCHLVERGELVDCVRSVDGFRWCGVVLQGDIPRRACSGVALPEESRKRHFVSCAACRALAERA